MNHNVIEQIRKYIGNPLNDTLTTLTAKWGNLPQSFAAWAGDMSGHALTSIAAKWGNMTETLLVVLGARADATVQTTVDASMHARLKGLLTSIGNPAAHTLTSLVAKFGDSTETLLTTIGRSVDAAIQDASATTISAGVRGLRTSLGNPAAHTLTTIVAKWGDIARSLDLILGARWDVAGDLGTDIAAIIAATGSTPVLTKATLGASNFFAGAIEVIGLTPAGPSELSGVSLSHNGFTAGAVITYTIYKMTNGVEDSVLSFTRIVGTDPDGVIIVDYDVIDGTGVLKTWRVTAQSNNAGDNARTMRYQYTTKRII